MRFNNSSLSILVEQYIFSSPNTEKIQNVNWKLAVGNTKAYRKSPTPVLLGNMLMFQIFYIREVLPKYNRGV